MTPEKYIAFTNNLISNLEADPRVVGLVAAGSMAKTDHMPDEWSDHDFWIITKPGAQEHFRTHYEWLPDSDCITLVFRETAHGLKVVYSHGHLVEYAVFDPGELQVARVNSYRVLIDREDVTAALADIHTRTVREADSRERDDAFLFGQFITNLMVGIGRYARGEQLSAHSFVKIHAINHLLPLLKKYGETTRHDVLDSIDTLRRFEVAFPEVGAELNAILLEGVPDAARKLLALVERQLRHHLEDYPAEAVEVVRRYAEKNGAWFKIPKS